MFTGIINGQGEILSADNRGSETRFRIRPRFALTDYVTGESIAVNGVCLTVETYADSWFSAYASAETLSCSNLGALHTGAAVNLERALAVGDRLGGHIVSGHVDCLATVQSVQPAGLSRVYRLGFPQEFGIQVVDKGSVTLDGISLTVNHCGPDFLEVNIIPETQKVTTIAHWKPGTRVNMETDIIGKYVQRMLTPWSSADKGGATAGDSRAGTLTMDFLREHGF
ncbi:riboflavin synthase, alpha subunit [Oleidesulfovibrio alaskensis G20]|jgi:riboflavin synthase|uniref:Riboflavin synthase n=1 Tax=Oleidesulfovibrio alaskensis (strain ATCC BAA-1058 / DSM 17464 / G20) TaxID=207559 RepID=Q30YL4_OLEA2|nr:riboflavin synthase [Oleidesulfovibrio alaskensis]ABB39232.1 riboflavin synthase, alpha subunit [Oleidesulfovibrio alaskensis G20]MBG0772013.1 riboflavin synthase [Oleidesulfovibrio alaskensis]MBL3581749.1 riboflavin synthase [Oleidesulfovibrio alaskensis]